MELKDILAKRRSVRKFSDKTIERELINQLLAMTVGAPSSRNSHSSRFMVVTGAENLAHIASMRNYGSAFVKNVPAAILVMGDRTKTDMWEINASISATTMQLACVDLGLKSCWVHVDKRPQLTEEPEGATAEEHLRERFTIPEEWSVLCAIALGYSDFQPAPLPEFNAAEMVCFVE